MNNDQDITFEMNNNEISNIIKEIEKIEAIIISSNK